MEVFGTMKINPKTLEKLREIRGLDQQALAERAGVSSRTILRIEIGESGETRRSTVEQIAKALRVKDVKVLAQEPESEAVKEAVSEALKKPEEEGEPRRNPLFPFFQQVKLRFNSETILAYGLVAEQYGVETRQIIKTAPLLFTLLAEMSLAARRRRLEDMEAAFEHFPKHLIPRSWLDLDAERASIGQRDIFTRHIHEHELNKSYYNEEFRNPFNDFLIEQAKSLPDNDAIDPEEIENLGNFDDLPSFSIFESYRKNLTGDSARADYALSHGYTRISKIPKELHGEDEDVTSERVKWLESKVPDEDWSEYENWIGSLNLSL